MPNVTIHLARMVRTPADIARPDPAGARSVLGFISFYTVAGACFGPNILPLLFLAAPVGAARAASSAAVGDYVFEVETTNLAAR